jgi:hypothetical protein
MLQRCGLGFGSLALAWLLHKEGRLRAEETAPAAPAVGHVAPPHVRPRARSVILLFMGGGPSQVDTFDPKPLLNELDGKNVPQSIAKNIPAIARSPLVNLWGSPFKFKKHGQSGIEITELYPELSRSVDDLCLIRSMRHESPIHAPAEYLALTGSQVGDRPSLGSWVTYGLGSQSDRLPAFVVFHANGDTVRAPGFASGFLPARFQGTRVAEGGPADLAMPGEYATADRRQQLRLIDRLNQKHLARLGPSAELEARIASYELAFKMQMAAPEAFDIGSETAGTRAIYGLDHKDTVEFGTQCLLARRLVERGVRFVQLRHGKWDAHNKLAESHRETCRYTDRPMAAMLLDLKQRGLLDETLVIWGGEFGRTPAAQGSGPTVGRDHSPSGYTMWLAGGGVRGGQVIGRTDDVGYAAIERPVHPNDLHATILHALGLDQHALSYLHHGRNEIPTFQGGEVVEEAFG